jgi:hypothetical protein
VILGAGFALLLHQRGLLVLHASAVEIGGGVVGFLGGAGWGKSTTAAALHACGHGFVCDDVLALALNDARRPIVLPTFPQLKLWPQVIASLGDDPETLPRVHSSEDKRVRRVAGRFASAPLPLACIYVLDGGNRTEIERLGSQEAFVELTRHSYAVHLLDATGATARHFGQCAGLANRVPVCRLRRENSLASLPRLAQAVQDHLAHLD